MVRRMLANAGHSVINLHRVRYGKLELGDLQEGEVREVEGEDHEWAEGLIHKKGKEGGGGKHKEATQQ